MDWLQNALLKEPKRNLRPPESHCELPEPGTELNAHTASRKT